MLTKEDIIAYFREFSYNNCKECPFRKECDILLYDSDHVLCKFMTQYAN